MLEFKDDQGMSVAVRHATHEVANFVTRTRVDAFDMFEQKAASVTVRAQRHQMIIDVAEQSDECVARFTSAMNDLSHELADGLVPDARLAVITARQHYTTFISDLVGALRQFMVGDAERDACITYLSRLNAFAPEEFLDISMANRSQKLLDLQESGTLSKWAQVFREDSVREKDISLALREAVAYAMARDAVDRLVEKIQEASRESESEVVPPKMLDDLSEDIAVDSVVTYLDEFTKPTLRHLAYRDLKLNDDMVDLVSTIPDVVHKSEPRLVAKAMTMIREDILPEVVAERV